MIGVLKLCIIALGGTKVADAHPGTLGFIEFTAVGFSDDRQQALVGFRLCRGSSKSKNPSFLVDDGLALLEKRASWELLKTTQFTPLVNWEDSR